jgi:hypothetical protein
MQAPEEVFATKEAGAPRAEEELSREDRKRRRAQVRRRPTPPWQLPCAFLLLCMVWVPGEQV